MITRQRALTLGHTQTRTHNTHLNGGVARDAQVDGREKVVTVVAARPARRDAPAAPLVEPVPPLATPNLKGKMIMLVDTKGAQ
jgi:hypothetical protein